MDINWDALKTLYATTQLSLNDLAKRERLKLHTVQERSRKDGWVAARMAFRTQAVAQAVDIAVDNEANRLAKIISAANSMAAVIEAVYQDPEQFQRHVVVDTVMDESGSKDVLTVEKQFRAVNTKAVRDMTAAIKDMTLVLRNLHNLPTQAEAEAQRIAAERLKLEQRKVEAAESANQVDKSIVVKLEGDLEAFAK